MRFCHQRESSLLGFSKLVGTLARVLALVFNSWATEAGVGEATTPLPPAHTTEGGYKGSTFYKPCIVIRPWDYRMCQEH